MTELALALVGVLAVVVLYLWFQLARVRRIVSAVPEDGNVFELLREIDTDLGSVEATVADLRPRLEAVERALPLAISYTGVVAYDAFGDVAGNLSRSIALLDSRGDGVVISLLVGRNETRFFTKQVRGRAGSEPLSPEEDEAVRVAMTSG
jgi:hypothetical protein